MNGFLPPLHDRFGTSPMGSRSVGPASSKYFGTSSPSAYHRNSPPQGFSHSYSYQGESGNTKKPESRFGDGYNYVAISLIAASGF
ncbi:hypothetical protein BGZ52_006787 [Haplosporangium bisporale]|nr:hypothetical protein BGZ52_006787 [Haplosporangium bisporale]